MYKYITSFVVGFILGQAMVMFVYADITETLLFPTNGVVYLNEQPEGAFGMHVTYDNIGDWTTGFINIYIDTACTDFGTIIQVGNCSVNPTLLTTDCAWSSSGTNEQIKCAELVLTGGTIDPDTTIPIASSTTYLFTFNRFLQLSIDGTNIDQTNFALGVIIFLFSTALIFTMLRKKK